MRYFIDTEFYEGPQDKTILGFKYGQTKPMVDLISIGIIAEDGMEYYAISKDFNLKQAWSDEWIRENVLLPIYQETINGDKRNYIDFSYPGMKCVLATVGKTNLQIAKDIQGFVFSYTADRTKNITDPVGAFVDHTRDVRKIEFWAYYADYDWVVFCQLFGRMIDLPEGFPMYCRDLKQLFDDKNSLKELDLKEYAAYPKQLAGEHNAICDARYNKRLYEFLISLK